MALMFFAILNLFTPVSFADVPISLKDQLKANFKIEKYKLSNGLTVILHEDHSIPMVSYHQWYRVGSHNEKVGRTGLAHFFEHLMFKGTDKYSGEKYELFVNGNGGANNAFTSRDYTGYYTLIPRDKLETVIDIEADRMVNLKFEDHEIKSERQVVKEERRMRVDNDPDGKLYELLYNTVFKISPYRWPVIGYMRDLNAAKMDELKAFYRSFYSPNNSVVVVVGAFDSSNVKKLIEKYYGDKKPQDLHAGKHPKEPEQKFQRKAQYKMDLQSSKVTVAYKGVDAFHKDDYALSLLGDILAGGESSRLYKLLVRKKQLATDVNAVHYGSKLEGVFAISADLRPGVSVSRAVEEINNEIQKIRKTAVQADELEKARNQTMLSYTKAIKSMSGKARILAHSEIIYEDPTRFFQDLDAYVGVTPQDVLKVARDYLNDKQQSIVSVVPK